MDQLLMAFAVFLIIQNLIVFTYIAAVQSSTEQYLEMKAAYDRQGQYFTTVVAIQKAVRKMAHDIRHHFVFLRSALDREDIPQAKSYLEELDQDLDNAVPLNVTGHLAVDALLHAKAKEAAQLGLRFRVEGMLPPNLDISPVDLNVVLGNALQNAVEAGARMEDCTGKEIYIAFSYNSSRLCFTLTNPHNGQIRRKAQGRFLSSKADGGLGVEIMDQVVKKYNGALATDIDDSTFTLTVFMNVQVHEE